MENDPKDLEIKKLKKEISISSIKQYGFILLFVAEVIFIVFMFGQLFNIKNPFSKTYSTNKVAVIHVDQEITSSLIERLIKSIEDIKDDKSYKALLVNVSSPGGSPSASQEFAEYLKDLNKTMPVTMYIDNMAASGAYYIASAIKPIYANKNAIVGSIGVIMPHYNAGELAQKLGIKEDTITAGKFKQPFSLFKEMSKENRTYIENSLLKPAYKNFVEDVAHNRNLPLKKIESYAQGKIYIANMPKIQGILVDKITNLFKLKKEIKKSLGDVDFVTIGKPPISKSFFHVLIQESMQTLFGKQMEIK